jgi:IS1 family transposase
MNRLSNARRAAIVRALVEGNSVRSTCRMTDTSKVAVLKLLVDVGAACYAYQRKHLRNLPCRRIQCDEIWSFVSAKAKNVPVEKQGFGVGDVWTWTAIDVETELVPSWLVATRDAGAATEFMTDLRSRVRGRVQITTDGHKVHVTAVEAAFGADVDLAMLAKIYGDSPEAEKRYSPAECTGCREQAIQGKPDPRHISKSYAERANLTMRMSMRRFTRLTNAFSKKLLNHECAIALHFMHYNFCRIHQSLRVTPAQAAGVTERQWSVEDIVALLDSK